MKLASMTVRVASRVTEALDICTFELVDAEGGALPGFAAGSHIDVHLPGGIVRQYSLCNDPGDTHRYQIGVLRDPASRGGSRAMHDAVRAGDLLQISPPKNHFPLAHEATRSLLLAGGIGVTPILCMAERLANSGSVFEFHYCSRSRERTAFMQRIAESTFASDVHFHFDDGPAGQKLDIPALLAAPVSGTHLYVCGPKGFMNAVLDAARAASWPEAQLHYEYFSAEVARSADDASFQIRLASSGRIVDVPADQSVVDALDAVGIQIPVSCCQGVCGTCLTRVLEGEPDHKDLYLTPEEQASHDQFLPCCSRSKSPMLVLDL